MAIEDFYDSTALVEKVVAGQTAMGGSKKNFTTRITALLGRLSSAKPIEVDSLGKRTVRNTWRFYCDASTTNKAILESDRFVISSKYYEILGIGNPGMQDHHLEIRLLEIL